MTYLKYFWFQNIIMKSSINYVSDFDYVSSFQDISKIMFFVSFDVGTENTRTFIKQKQNISWERPEHCVSEIVR